MDKKDWQDSLLKLKAVLKLKRNIELPRLHMDIEELEYTIKCYKKKIEKFK